ncbi:hypothetical protein MKP05_17890 [Halomonas sp. EGI 63088]|uniref:Uncharacterized protein n=1 Tax=Halomonas flagellata TaxID=2920385 RepID=A0ABS9RYT0_9GAMM|nr:hypothetical protein [Halomonas flagellata]MCH4564974.1 hypothetical protein [Halomonas flagellata]
MTHDKQTRIPGTGRRLAAAAAIVALSLGTLALAGCDNGDEMPPMEQDAPMEEPAQDPGMQEGSGANEEPMGSNDDAMSGNEDVMGSQDQEPVQEPVEEDPMSSEEETGSEETMAGDDQEEEEEDS